MNEQVNDLGGIEKRALQWCRGIHPLGLGRSARVAELYDHVMCEIEARTAAGLEPEQALAEALARLGKRQDLLEEYAKLKGWSKWSVVLGALSTGNSRVLGKQLSAVEHFALLLIVPLSFLLAIPAALTWIPDTRLALFVALGLIPAQWMSSKALMFSAPAR